jgi:hypothetical protein
VQEIERDSSEWAREYHSKCVWGIIIYHPYLSEYSVVNRKIIGKEVANWEIAKGDSTTVVESTK